MKKRIILNQFYDKNTIKFFKIKILLTISSINEQNSVPERVVFLSPDQQNTIP